MNIFNEPLLIKEVDNGRVSVEESHPEEMAKINELRAKRDSLYKEASKCQNEIDEIYNELGDFNQFIGKVVLLDHVEDEDEEYYSIELMKVASVERLFSGAKLVGTTVYISFYENGECNVSYHKNGSSSFKYKSADSITVVKDEMFDDVVNKAKELIV